jgi:GNAT superfamily N-acetyltransferase
MQEQPRLGLDYLEAATALLCRARNAHPTAGSLEAADLQWWWRTPRATDNVPQLFWFDGLGQPEAAVIATDWGDGIALDPIFMPGAARDWVAHVIARGLAHARALGFETVDIVIDGADTLLRDVLASHGFGAQQAGALQVACAWLNTDARPAISPLPAGYRLASRQDTMHQPHHMIQRSGVQVQARLRQTSLYRPELDLLVFDAQDNVAAYTLCWFDPHTATGLVEPMRTENDHQRRGLARHLLTNGIARLAQAGAKRIKICFSPDNAAAKGLYLSVGFAPSMQTVIMVRQASASA